MKVKKQRSKTNFSFFVKCLYPFRWWILAQVLVSILWAVDLSLRPYLIKTMLDKISDFNSESDYEALVKPALFYIFMSGLVVINFRFYDYICLQLTPRLKKNIAIQLMNRMIEHSHYFYQNHFSGSLANKINNVIDGIPSVIKTSIDQFFSHSLALIIAVFTVWNISPKFALALVAWLTLFILGTIKMLNTAKKLADNAADVRSTVVGHVVDIVANIVNVRFFTNKKKEIAHLDSSFQEAVETDQKRDLFFMRMHAFQGGSFVVFQSVCLWWLIAGLKNHTVTAGDFALVLTLNISIIDCLWTLSKDLGDFSENLSNVTQGLRIVQHPLEIEDKPFAKDLVVSRGKIVFENVHFKFQNAQQLFQHKSVTILPAQKVGLVGYSGSGKSTFAHLILRLFDVTQGRILIDDQDIRDVTQESLRQSIGIIPQDPSLFHRTLMENIRYGSIHATDEEVIQAAKMAHAHEFIINLEEKYDSMVGERGVKLSGGQRQRIAIARAILKNAPLLIFDEATSQLDSVTEAYIQESLEKLMHEKTTLVIAHRLSTLLHLDRILVFDQGKIVEDGNHHQLILQNGLYKVLWDTQVGGFLPKEKKISSRYAFNEKVQ